MADMDTKRFSSKCAGPLCSIAEFLVKCLLGDAATTLSNAELKSACVLHALKKTSKPATVSSARRDQDSGIVATSPVPAARSRSRAADRTTWFSPSKLV